MTFLFVLQETPYLIRQSLCCTDFFRRDCSYNSFHFRLQTWCTYMESTDASENDGPACRCCIIHVSNKPSEKKQRCNIMPFDEKNWRMVQAAAEKRRSNPQFAISFYYDVIVRLPHSPDETRHGYHASCYQKSRPWLPPQQVSWGARERT